MLSSNLLVTVAEHDPQNDPASLTDESSVCDSRTIEDVVPRSCASSPRKSTKLPSSLKTNIKDKMNHLPFNSEMKHSNDFNQMKGVQFMEAGEANKDEAYNDHDGDNETNVTSIETKNVERVRSFILTTLIFSFLLVGVVLYFKLSNDNEDDFYMEYNEAVEIINISIHSRIVEKINILNALGTLAVTQAAIMSTNTSNSSNTAANVSAFESYLVKSGDDVEGSDAVSKSNWPRVTIPNFEQRANNFKQLSNSLYLSINPIVTIENRMLWEDYVRTESSSWMSESIQFGLDTGIENYGSSFWNENHFYNTNRISTSIYYTSSETVTQEGQSLDALVYSTENGTGPYVPIWQTSPLMRSMINQNTLRYSSTLYQDMQTNIDSNSIVLGNLMTTNSADDTNNFMSSYFTSLLSTSIQSETTYEGDPMTHIYFPIREDVNPSYSIDENYTKPPAVAMAVSLIQWGSLFSNILPSHTKTIVAVMESSCAGNFTYYITGQDVQYAGIEGDYHNEAFDEYVTNITLDDVFINHPSVDNETIQSVCSITFSMYPTTALYEESVTMLPATIGWVLFVLLMITICLFVIFDRVVERRQSQIEAKAQVTGSILTSLFPKDVANRLITQSNLNNQIDHSLLSNKHRLKSFLQPDNVSNDDGGNLYGLEPIADLFPATTVLFSDIAGFTAWSSSREPSQVFVLLQSVYQGFDMLARRRRVFKVETIGDSYVAVTGVPDPQEHHAMIMARFATECQQKMAEITNDLVVKLGPDTSELRMRMGMHSGPVTGGVLVGDRARFQLFGDTVNTAARMESTGMKEKIQVSLETANLIMAAGKTHWLTPRKDPVVAKGKGVLTTYWLNLQTTAASRTSFSSQDEPLIDDSSRYHMDSSSRPPAKSMRNAYLSNPDQTLASSTPSSVYNTGAGSFRDDAKYDRLIDWLSEVLQSHILRVIASRTANANLRSSSKQNVQDLVIVPTGPPMNEVVEAIFLPEYQSNYKKYRDRELDLVELNPVVVSQLREYIAIIARCYKDNPFHNFEHACHVTMSVNKLLMRVTTPDIDIHKMARKATQAYRQLHEYTHGINSDSITQLGIIFSAIIHDVDHQGISNVQLSKEQPALATKYNSQSVAEQNSLDIAWDLLMSDQFKLLRNCIFKTVDELQRFRQVLVNTVLATDIFDKELKELRQKRWETAFSSQINALGNEHGKNLQATIVIEHLMQASDVSHTMQHWHVYRKWNARLFKELYLAFRDGRMAGNPCEFWYKGELGFFDNYIIPLAKKLKECNVFGVSSDEYLNYAEKNRAEWAIRGEEIVSEMILEVTSCDQD